ncbi:hypothetical protein BMS3Abin07_00009 [bacterium BMS3Abin07]|nr:hypothetical protein BMS3Abin07_00009 [bacterium BMS3Abin07]
MSIKREVYLTATEAIEALLRSLVTYEQKYQMSSDEFYTKYLSGKLEDTRDFIEWAGDYQQYIELRKEIDANIKISA